jgi:hypothetical protein
MECIAQTNNEKNVRYITSKSGNPRIRKRRNKLAECRQIQENIKLNEQTIIDANVENKKVAKRYEDVFNEQNKNLYSVKQEPYEPERDYIQRIKELDTMKYDPTL